MLMSKSLAAAAMTACAMFGANFFPLEQGNYWKYQASSGESFEVRVGVPIYANDQVYYSLSGYAPERLLVRLNESNNLVYLDEERRMDAVLTSFEPFDRGWWEAPQRACELEGQTAEKRGTHTGPAGTLRDVLEVRYRSSRCADTGVASEQYAENLGMVRREVTTFAGPRVFNLVEAHVGTITIDGLAHGRFTVSVTDPPAGDLTVRLRLSTRPVAAMKLEFPSAQEFDVVVRDLNGNVVWQWSAGRVFAQEVHELTVVGEWTATVQVPRPADAGAYTIEGWLTTDGPRFAATIPDLGGPSQKSQNSGSR